MFGRTSASKKIIAVADIGSGSAAVALIAVHTGGPALIVASARVSLSLEERNQDAVIKGILASLAEAGQKASASFAATPYKGTAISSVYAVIRAPWTRSKTERATSKSEKDLRVTNPMIGNLAQQAIGADTEMNRANLIESSVVRVELNGYPTAVPVGKSAHQLSVVTLLSDCDPAMKSGVEETLVRLFPGMKPTLRSGVRGLLNAMHAMQGISEDQVILDVEGEATNALIVRDGLVSESVLIPEGMRSIIKRVSEKGLPEETLSLLRMAERDESADTATSAIKTSIARVEPELARVYGEALTKIATISRLPTSLLLVTHADLLPWLSTFFTRIDFTQCTVTAQPFVVRGLQVQDLTHLAVADANVTADIGIVMACALVNSETRS